MLRINLGHAAQRIASSPMRLQITRLQSSSFGKARVKPRRVKYPSSTSPGSKRRKRRPHKEQSVFGLTPVDYTVKPPIIFPPPPPPRGGASRFAIPFTLVTTLSIIIYVYRNNKNDSYEYWRAMQSGEVVLMGDDDDDDEYDDDEEEEE